MIHTVGHMNIFHQIIQGLAQRVTVLGIKGLYEIGRLECNFSLIVNKIKHVVQVSPTMNPKNRG